MHNILCVNSCLNRLTEVCLLNSNSKSMFCRLVDFVIANFSVYLILIINHLLISNFYNLVKYFFRKKYTTFYCFFEITDYKLIKKTFCSKLYLKSKNNKTNNKKRKTSIYALYRLGLVSVQKLEI